MVSSESSNMWPSLSETFGNDVKPIENNESFDWEFVSTDQVRESNTFETKPKGLKHCVSSPNFGEYELMDENTVSSCHTSTDDSSIVIIPVVPAEKTNKVRRVPSFKDAILLNAEEREKEEEAKKQREAKSPQKIRKMGKAKLVVTPIKKRSFSANDLRSLVISEDDGGGSGGGGGCGKICEDSIVGDTDAAEFYGRKTHGYKTHKNGMKLRPDEAKRKEHIMFKKNAQRERQAARQR